MSITGSVEFKVEPSVLKIKAQEVEQMISSMRWNFINIQTAVDSTKPFWIGEAGDLHRRLYEEQKESISEIFNRLDEHPRDLMIMAGVYDEAEKKNLEEAVSMRGDVIV